MQQGHHGSLRHSPCSQRTGGERGPEPQLGGHEALPRSPQLPFGGPRWCPARARPRPSSGGSLSHTTRKALAGTSGAASSRSATGTCNTALLRGRRRPCPALDSVGSESPAGRVASSFSAFRKRMASSMASTQNTADGHINKMMRDRSHRAQAGPPHVSWGGGSVYDAAGLGAREPHGSRETPPWTLVGACQARRQESDGNPPPPGR